MKVLLVGLGRWGSEVVDRFRFIRKKTPKRRPRDVLSYRRLDPIKKTPIFLGIAGIPTNIVFLVLGILLKIEEMRFSALFAFFVFLISFAVISLIMYLLFSFSFGRFIVGDYATENDKEIIMEIKERLEIPGTVHVITKGERDSIYKYLEFQKKAFFTTLILGVIISCCAAVFFYVNYDTTVKVVIDLLVWLLRGRRYLVENVLTSFGVPLLLSLALRNVILIYYLPQIHQKDLGKKKAEKILRSHVDCVGISFHDDIDDLRYIDNVKVIPERRKDLSDALKDQILYYFNKKVTEEGKVYDAVMFFGIAGSDIVQKFSEVSPSIKKSLIGPSWFYIRFPNNFITEEQRRGIKKLLMDMDCVFAEEEKGRIFTMSPDREDYTRVRVLERLFAIGESGKTRSIRAIDVGDIRSMARRNTFSTLAYGYIEQIPEQMKDNEKLMAELYNLTMEQRSLLDMDMNQAKYALATVKRQAEEPEEGPIYDYDAIRDFLWEKFGENIRVYDIEYVLYNLKTMKPAEIDKLGIPVIVTRENRSGEAIKEEIFIITHEDEEGYIEPIADWEDKYHLIDRLQYKNLLVDDIKRKELWIMFSGIDPDKILDKYMAESEYEKDFSEMISQGVVMGPSVFSRLSPESLKRFIKESQTYGIGDLYIPPLLFKKVDSDSVMGCLEKIFPDIDERKEMADEIISTHKKMKKEIKSIVKNSSSVVSASQDFINDLLKGISSKTGMKEDSPDTKLLAEIAWLSHVKEIPIIALGLGGIEPELLSVYRKMALKFKIDPENLTERFRGILKDWELAKSEIFPDFSDLYLIDIGLGYGDERGITMTKMEYMGGVHGRKEKNKEESKSE